MTASDLIRPPANGTAHRRPRLSAGFTFWFVGAILAVFLMASTAPSPMYAIYQQRWGFSSTVLTEVFATYALAILVSLLLFGSLSDRIGRRPVLLVALAVEIVSIVLLAAAPGVATLFVGRTLQGLATGLATSAVSGALLDFQKPGTSRGALFNGVAAAAGMAAGSALSGALVQFAPAPTVLTYVVLVVCFALAFLGVLVMPERVVAGRLRGALRPQRPTLPAGHQTRFLLLATTMLATWMVSGMFLSLGPSLAKGMVDGQRYLVAGLSVMVLTGVGALAQIVCFRMPGRRVVRLATPLVLVGLAGVAASALLGDAVVFFGSAAVLGVGWGMMFMGGFRLLSALASPETRAGTSAMIYVVSYLSTGVPSMVFGLLTTVYGLITATLTFTATAAAATLTAALATRPTTPSRCAGQAVQHQARE